MPVTMQPIGNCNVQYLTNLSGYPKPYNPRDMMFDALTSNIDENGYPRIGKRFKRSLYNGIFLFAQGSDDNIKERPYGPMFRDYILAENLGTVMETPPVPNALHGNNPGTLYIWILNKPAITLWIKKALAEYVEQAAPKTITKT